MSQVPTALWEQALLLTVQLVNTVENTDLLLFLEIAQLALSAQVPLSEMIQETQPMEDMYAPQAISVRLEIQLNKIVLLANTTKSSVLTMKRLSVSTAQWESFARPLASLLLLKHVQQESTALEDLRLLARLVTCVQLISYL